MQHGYQLLKIHEVYHQGDRSDTIFKDQSIILKKMKVEGSGFPATQGQLSAICSHAKVAKDGSLAVDFTGRPGNQFTGVYKALDLLPGKARAESKTNCRESAKNKAYFDAKIDGDSKYVIISPLLPIAPLWR